MSQAVTLNPGDSVLVSAAISMPVPPLLPTAKESLPTVAVINQSMVLTDAQVDRIAAALQIQADRDFSHYWGTSCHIVRAMAQTAPVGSWWLVFLDTTDQAGALGYHDLTPAGLPMSKIFAKTDQQYGLSPSVTASHELLEMLADPFISEGVIDQTSNTAGYIIAREVGDPVEADNMGYNIALQDGSTVPVSDFATPAWFQPGLPGPFDFMKHCSQSLQLTKGGYISYFSFTTPGWKQATAHEGPAHVQSAFGFGPIHAFQRSFAKPGSRRERRERGRPNWQLSRVGVTG